MYATLAPRSEKRTFDPILRLEQQLIKNKNYTASEVDEIHHDVNSEVEEAVRFALDSNDPEISSSMDHMIES